MTLICAFDATPLPDAVPAPVRAVATLAEAHVALADGPRERLVIIGPNVATSDAITFALTARSHHPHLSLILVRRDPAVADVLAALRAGIGDVVDLGDATALADACTRLQTSAQPSSETRRDLSAPGKIITVFSAKGGAGKTTISTNLALALNDGGDNRVCLVDLDLAFGDIAITLRLKPIVTIADAIGMTEPTESDLESIVTNKAPNLDCLLAPVSPSVVERIPAKLVHVLLTSLARYYAYVVIDTPAQLNDHVLAALDVSDYAVLITTPEFPSLKNLRLTLDLLDTLNYCPDTRAVVLNRADSSVGLDLGDVERVIKTPLAVRVPSSVEVPRSINKGVPIVAAHPEHPVSAAIRRLAAENFDDDLIATAKHRDVPRQQRSWFRRSA